MGGHSGQIRSIRAVHHQRHLRGDGEGRAEGPAGPHLLLGGKDKGTVHGQFIPQEGEQHGAAQPAPQRLSLEQARPEVSGVTVKGRCISQSDLRLRPGPVPGSDVDIELVQLGDGLLLLPADQMVGLESHHPRHPLGPYQHRLAQEHPAVDGAHSVEFQIAVVGDLADHEPNLVHVGGEEKLAAGMFPALFPGNQVAQSVHPQPVCVWLHLRQE
ncbi:Uncharacterised protein [Flavonifractor plautii]|uniref:Uncharacterized protein n=1 Tax=Flavonifractor plautii TaxID=292800 RepID=A0A174ISA7_FLAPL|nr:Uncharacterised protein [Flavonifractor plautii]